MNNPLTLNLYTYVHNNPLKYVDPTGHKKSGNKHLSDYYNNQFQVFTTAREEAQKLIFSLDKKSSYYKINLFAFRKFQYNLDNQADSIRTSYYETLTNPSMGEMNAAKQVGYLFGIKVDLGVGWSFREDSGSPGNGTKDHIHVNGPKGKH
ncbi:hypothetical protein ACFSTH_11660 [Paenibacillus yanchengensis]|uniref:Bacterial toxin 44 domain-containing protein n=1 Tax=Paenibacillus yanchengensis TaxID=2035833 RepID=A0ABW4YIQ2_9BACL